jgi:hypothetical protein
LALLHTSSPVFTSNTTTAATMTVDDTFTFVGQPHLIFGQKFEPQFRFKASQYPRSWNDDKEATKRHFQPAPGVYRARDLIAMFGPLLDTVIQKVGGSSPASSRDVLLHGLSSILATSGRESSLPLRQTGRTPEMAAQADAISAALLGYVRESLDVENANPKFAMSSHCDGHLWTHGVVGELMGVRGSSTVMQLYNEWSHRIVLLRNALMPFENWYEVPIVIGAGLKGLRTLEAPSNKFAVHLLSGRLPQNSIVDMAKALTAPSLPSGGFGFQYSQGTVLPAFLGGSKSIGLLRWYPAKETSQKSDVLFDYEYKSYEKAPRSVLPLDTTQPSSRPSSPATDISELRSRPIPGASGPRAHLRVEVELRGHPEAVFPVCLGQIARGWRFATRAPQGSKATAPEPESAAFHKVEDALAQPGLVFSAEEREKREGTVHVFPIEDSLLGLALFGKLYPGNVVVLGKKDPLAIASKIGRGFGTKFVHWPQL